MNIQLFRWVGKIGALVLAASYLLAVFAVVRIQLLPLLVVLIGVPLGTLLIGLLVYAQLKKKLSAAKLIVAIVVSLVLTVGNVYAILVSNATASFLGSLEEDEYTTIQYSIIAKKTQKVSLRAANQPMGLLQADPYNAAVKKEVNKKTNSPYKSSPHLTGLMTALDENKITMATLRSSYMELLKENQPTVYKSVETLATFTIKVKKEAPSTKTDISQPFVVYISGIDTDGPISSVSRSDVNMLAVINPKTHKILLVNTPRDYYVQLNGTTGVRDKLTHAGIYGVGMSVRTLEDLYQTDIDYYLRINFASLTKLVDALGGVTVDSAYSFTAGGYSFQKGKNLLDGRQALAFSRERYGFENGDRTRGENQQRVIEAIIHKLSSPETLGNYQAILGAMEGAFQTNASKADITGLIRQQMDDLKRWDVKSMSVDGTGKTAPTYSMGDLPLYVMEPDMASVQAARREIQQYQR